MVMKTAKQLIVVHCGRAALAKHNNVHSFQILFMVAKTLADNPFQTVTGDSSAYFLFCNRQPQARMLPIIGFHQNQKILVRRFALCVVENSGVFLALQ